MFRKYGHGENSGSRGLPTRMAGWSPGFSQWSHVTKSLRKTTRHCKERITMAKNKFTVRNHGGTGDLGGHCLIQEWN